MNKHIIEKIESGVELDSRELEELIRSLPEGSHHQRLEDARFEVIRSEFKIEGVNYSLRWLRQVDAPEGVEPVVRQYGQPWEF